jgi:hypothetical protein
MRTIGIATDPIFKYQTIFVSGLLWSQTWIKKQRNKESWNVLISLCIEIILIKLQCLKQQYFKHKHFSCDYVDIGFKFEEYFNILDEQNSLLLCKFRTTNHYLQFLQDWFPSLVIKFFNFIILGLSIRCFGSSEVRFSLKFVHSNM